jgi:uncharacterized protein (TIGR00369 family)
MSKPAAPTPAIGCTPVETAKTMTGLALLQGIMDGTLPLPPICQALDFRFVELSPGIAVVAGTPDFRFYNTLGTVHGGYTATLLDSCMSSAVQTHLKAGLSYATVEFKVNLVRPLAEGVGTVRAEGKVINMGRTIATAEGRLVDAAGKLYAHGTTTCLVFPL